MTLLEMASIGIGVIIIGTVAWKILRHGTVPPTLDVDPDSRSGIGGGPD